jgi:hypothetical protein
VYKSFSASFANCSTRQRGHGRWRARTSETVIGYAEAKQIFELSRTSSPVVLVTDGRVVARGVFWETAQFDGGILDAAPSRLPKECVQALNWYKMGDFSEYQVGTSSSAQLEAMAQKL